MDQTRELDLRLNLTMTSIVELNAKVRSMVVREDVNDTYANLFPDVIVRPEDVEDYHTLCPMEWFAKYGDLDNTMRLCVFELFDPRGCLEEQLATALIVAGTAGNKDYLCSVLTELPAYPNFLVTYQGEQTTPYIHACRHGHDQAVLAYIECMWLSRTCLHDSVSRPDNGKIIDLIIHAKDYVKCEVPEASDDSKAAETAVETEDEKPKSKEEMEAEFAFKHALMMAEYTYSQLEAVCHPSNLEFIQCLRK